MDSKILVKTDKVIYKLYNQNRFIESLFIPSMMYPLASAFFEEFDDTNTYINEDKKVAEVLDRIIYNIGKCYHNTAALKKALTDEGYNAKSYVGWVIIDGQIPTHHAWIVLREGDKKHILDLSNDNAILHQNAHIFKNVSPENLEDAFIEFKRECYKQKNSIRCSPLGKANGWVYVGCEQDAEDGIILFRNLIRKYPDHPAIRRCDKNWLTPIQSKLLQKEK